jgi:hypothetical protein
MLINNFTRCIICNRPMKTKKNAQKFSIGPVCSKRNLIESKSSLSKLYEQILKEKDAEGQSSYAEMNMDLNKEKFESFNHQVPFKNPEVLTTNIIELVKSDLQKILLANPKMGGRTEIETLLDLNENEVKKFTNLKIGQKMVGDCLDAMKYNYALFIQEHLYYEDCTMLESQVAGVRDFVHAQVRSIGKSKIHKHVEIKEAIKYNGVTDKESEAVVNALLEVSTLIPDKYKKNVPPITVLVRKDGPGQISFAAFEKAVLVLNVRTNKVLQAAEAFHEYVHLIEHFNKNLMKKTNEFLKSRRVDSQKRTLKEVSEKYNKHYRPDAGNIEVYEDHFMDAYAGRVYGDLDGKDAVPTEVLTVGCEVIMLDPVGFCVKDRDYFNFIANFLKGKI